MDNDNVFSGYVDLGYAKLDTDRYKRTGFHEVVYCKSKEDFHLPGIFKELFVKNGQVLGTRCSPHQFELIKNVLPQAEYSAETGLVFARNKDSIGPGLGNIVVISAGSSDFPVAEEAALCAEFWGQKVTRIYDCGISGIHRLLSQGEELDKANVIIAVAGMEGALASVVAGLVKVPVIAVPTSVGYGANLEGIATLLSMINSCANGISVVNIDNGFGAAYNATEINRLAVNGSRGE